MSQRTVKTEHNNHQRLNEAAVDSTHHKIKWWYLWPTSPVSCIMIYSQLFAYSVKKEPCI